MEYKEALTFILWLIIIIGFAYIIPKTLIILATPFVYTPQTFNETSVASYVETSIFLDGEMVIIRANVSDSDPGDTPIDWVKINITDSGGALRVEDEEMTDTGTSCGTDCNIYELNFTLIVHDGWSFDAGLQENTAEGLACNGSHFWVVGTGSDAVYRYNSTGDYDGWNFDVSGEVTEPRGLSFNGTYFWVVDWTNQKVFRYDSAGNYDNWYFDTSGPAVLPQNVYYNDSHFYLTDNSNNKVYEYNSTGNYTNWYFYVGAETSDPRGIYFDGDYFWIGDPDNKRVLRYSDAGNYSGYYIHVAQEMSVVRGVANCNNYWYVLDQYSDKTFRYTYDVPTGVWLVNVTAADTQPNYASNSTTFNVTTKPIYGNFSTNSTLAGTPVEFRVQWSDDKGLSHYIFSISNGTDMPFENQTWTQFVNETSLIGYWTVTGTNGAVHNLDGDVTTEVSASDGVISDVDHTEYVDFLVWNDSLSGGTVNNVTFYFEVDITDADFEWWTSVDGGSTWCCQFDPAGTPGTYGCDLYSCGIDTVTELNALEVQLKGMEVPDTGGPDDGTLDYGYLEINYTTAPLEAWSNQTYIVNDTVGTRISWRVYANDTDNHWTVMSIKSFDTTSAVLAFLDVSLVYPPAGSTTNVNQNTTFNINASVTCRGGDCGTVYGTARYNFTSDLPDTPINKTLGDKPFYNTSGAILQTCGSMSQGESCQLNWTVNATGDVDTYWKVGVLFNSTQSGIADNHTDNATINIILCTEGIHLSWDYIDFDNLNPNTYWNAAPGNSPPAYNITNNGTCTLKIWINGTDLINVTNPSNRIGVGNFSWSNTTDNSATSYNTSTSLQIINHTLTQGNNVTMYFWLGAPPVYHGLYNGTITICGNYSTYCS